MVDLRKQIKGYPAISEAMDDEPKENINDGVIIKKAEIITTQKPKINPRIKLIKPLDLSTFPPPSQTDELFSDGDNDKKIIGKYDLCVNATPSKYALSSQTKIFYTLFKPVKPDTSNPDIASIHLADHQVFKMMPTFSGRLAPNITDFNLEDRKTVIYIHGFRSKSFSRTNLLQQFFRGTNGEFNLILVDWSLLAQNPDAASKNTENPDKYANYRSKRGLFDSLTQSLFDFGASFGNYQEAYKNRHVTAKELYSLMDIIMMQLHPSKIHLVGHSLGAHIAGETAYFLHKNTGLKVGRITGLDPASLCFTETDDLALQKQLTRDKADFVDVWHSNANLEKHGAGVSRPIGHIDYWINGGKFQPICKNIDSLNSELGQGVKEILVDGGVSPCSHSMVEHYFIDSLNRCKDSFTAYSINKKDIYDYLHDGKGEVEIEFNKFFATSNAKGMSFWTGDLAVEETGSGTSSGVETTPDFSDESTTVLEQSFGSFENYPSFWEGSRNFVVFTKQKERNPNKSGELELKFWTGYCED